MSDKAVVALAGRRIDAEDAEARRFPMSSIAAVREQLARLFVEQQAIALVSSAACGSDLIGLEEAERIGLRRRIVLPFPRNQFRTTSVVDRPGDWGPRFDRLVDVAEQQHDLVVAPSDSDPAAAYVSTNRLLLEHAKALAESMPGSPHRLVAIVVWEGAPRPGHDLTDDFRRAAITSGFDVHAVLTNRA